jgi:hypothetical protein
MLVVLGHVVGLDRQLGGGQHSVDQRIAPDRLEHARGGPAADHQRRQGEGVVHGLLDEAGAELATPRPNVEPRASTAAPGALGGLLLLEIIVQALDRIRHSGQELRIPGAARADLLDDQLLLQRPRRQEMPAKRQLLAAPAAVASSEGCPSEPTRAAVASSRP